ncbi:hypothetical protein [Saccharopolyspora antimicrobica]|uniref:hypothetical protein n=1 Tax=Saccharopolyspora antimicrobica TaxID=455193 RepID=UPI0014776A70|nr:hypothetical protein [Saccharopolyspora antimicrobica]
MTDLQMLGRTRVKPEGECSNVNHGLLFLFSLKLFPINRLISRGPEDVLLVLPVR